jgi:hypothetical protein
MTIKCAKCSAAVTVNENQFGSLCACPGCKAILLIPRLKGAAAPGEKPVVAQAKSIEDLRKELLDLLRPEFATLESRLQKTVQDASANAGAGQLSTEQIARQVSDTMKPELERWMAARITATAAGLDTEALRDHLRADILREVRADLAAMRPSASADPATTEALTRALEALGTRLAGAPATPAPAAAAAPPATQAAEPRRSHRRPFQKKAVMEEEDIPEDPKEAYPAIKPESPDVNRAVSLNAGDNEGLKAFLEEVAASAGNGLLMFEPTQSRRDVGNWRRARVWIAVTPEKIVLAAYGRRPFRQEIGTGELKESFWNEFTSEVVFVPYQAPEGAQRSVKLTQDRGFYLLGFIHHGVPA